MEFAWFYTLKFCIILILLYFSVNPFVKQYRTHGDLKIKSKYPYVIAFVLIILILFNPIKINNSEKVEMTRKTYDTQIQELGEIKLRAKEKYEAPSNENEIKTILEK